MQPLLRFPKYGGVTPYFDRCAIRASLHLPPAALGDEARHARASDKFWQGQKGLVSPAGSVGASALRAEVSTGDPHPSTRSACRVFKLFNPSQNKKTPAGVFLFWQGQKDLNPRHAVLETAALPTELYPYICEAPKIGASWWATRDSNPGPFGYEPSALTN